MDEKPDLIERLREGLADGEKFDRDMMAAGWRLTRDVYLRAFLQLFEAGLPEGSSFFVRGGRLFGGGQLVHHQHPEMSVRVTPWDDIWLPPVPEVVDDLWKEVARLASEHPERVRQAVWGIEQADRAFNTCPP